LIEKLEFLIAVAREENFRRAAEACGVAQPTLSAAIKALEEQLGVLLIRRNARFQGLTPEGERVLTWAKRMVADSRAMREEVRTLRRGLSGQLRLAVVPSALPFTPVLTKLYRRDHPDVHVTVLTRSSIEILGMLDGLEADAGITYLGNETIGRLRTVSLYAERYRLLTAQSGPMRDRTSVTWAEVRTLPLCLLTPDMQNRRILDRLIGPEALATAITLESDSVIALIAHVRDGGLTTIVSDRVAHMLAGQAPFRSAAIIEPDASFEIGLVAPERQPSSPLVETLMTMVRRAGTFA
jgi:DNA-binding transcriptional LysR family regulator